MTSPADKLPPDSEPEISLTEYIEINQKMLSVLGVFTTMTVFANNLPQKFVGDILSVFPLTVVVLIWSELWSSFPKRPSTKLVGFQTIRICMVGMLGLYWLVKVHNVLQQYALGVLVILLLIFSTQIITKTRFYRLISWIVPPLAKHTSYSRRITTLYWLLLLGIAILVLALALSLWLAIDSFLDEIEIVIEKADPPSGS